MTYDEQRLHVERFFKTAHLNFAQNGLQLCILKGSDYRPENIPLTDAFFAAADIHATVPQILWIHVRKHNAAIANYMQGGLLQTDNIRQRLLDVANYMALIDSYVADPVRWLRHLDVYIKVSGFPHREPDEIERLQTWIEQQMRSHGATDGKGNNPLEQTLSRSA